MMIKLENNFFIDVDDRNFTLKSEYINQKTDKPAIRTHGYFSNLENAVEYYIMLAALDVNDGKTIELLEYVETIKNVCKETIEVILNERKIDN